MTAARILSDSLYVNGAAIPASFFPALDKAQYQALWGDTGGTWTPADIITIAGAGLWICGPSSIASASAIVTSSGNTVTLGDSGQIGLSPNVNRSFTVSIGAMGIDASYVGYGIFGTYSNPRFVWDYTADSLDNQSSNTGYQTGARLVVPLDVHHGATLYSVDLYFIVSPAHNGLTPIPASLPQLRVFKVDAFGNVTNLTDPANVSQKYVGNGFVTVTSTPANGTAWYASGNPQQIVCYMLAGTVIDTTQYSYFAEIVDEQGPRFAGTQPGNQFCSLVLSFLNIANMGPQ